MPFSPGRNRKQEVKSFGPQDKETGKEDEDKRGTRQVRDQSLYLRRK
jgi:hypothetical protein